MSLQRWASLSRGFVSHRWTTTSSLLLGRERRWLGSKAPPPKRELFREDDVVERFTKGSGPGGQKINKVMNCVQLLHLPTRTKVECQQFRALTANRQRARSLLQEKLDLLAVSVPAPPPECSLGVSRPRPRPRSRPRSRPRPRSVRLFVEGRHAHRQGPEEKGLKESSDQKKIQRVWSKAKAGRAERGWWRGRRPVRVRQAGWLTLALTPPRAIGIAVAPPPCLTALHY